jgi:4-hydroxybutyryl-CoA dehydratase/vinylacetyl-CoA-Delta-isomerase
VGLRTSEQYRDGLRDGRRVIYRGQEVKDVASFPPFAAAIDHSAICYDIAVSHPDIAIAREGGTEYAAFYAVPRSAQELADRGRLIQAVSALGAGMITLKEVGSDALFALLKTLRGVERERAVAFWQHCRDHDVALAVAQTDVKGNRALPPHAQADPDLYLHVVGEDADSITVRGAKAHTSFSANADELIILPTRAMGPQDHPYAVSFAIPVDTPGLTLYISPFSDGSRNASDFPISARHKMLESLTVFDDVRVPKERVFLHGRPEQAGELALAFAGYHRFTAVNYKLPLLDLIVGCAFAVAEANGIAEAGHVRDKLAELIAYAETVRGLAELAAIRSYPGDHGIQQPDPLTVNLAKYHFAHGYHAAVGRLQDLAGGLLVTGPGAEDWDNPAVAEVLGKYLTAAVPGRRRYEILSLVADLTVREYGGYQTVLATHAEGSLEAEKLQIRRSYDPARARLGVAAILDAAR